MFSVLFSYYKGIRQMVPVSDQDMNTHLAEVSRVSLCIIHKTCNNKKSLLFYLVFIFIFCIYIFCHFSYFIIFLVLFCFVVYFNCYIFYIFCICFINLVISSSFFIFMFILFYSIFISVVFVLFF